MMSLKEMFQLSDRGARDLKKGILACTLTNLSLMLSVVVTVQIFVEVLRPLTGGAVSWSKMWMLFGAGIVAVVVHFFYCKMTIGKLMCPAIQRRKIPVFASQNWSAGFP